MTSQYTCGHAPEVMCRECHPEAFDNAPRSPVYVHAECGCELKDDTKIKWCPYHVSGLQETIKAREREASDLRYRVRERQKDVDILAKQLRERTREANALQNAVKQLREQIPDNDQDITSNATIYCCMHMRWETREGAGANGLG